MNINARLIQIKHDVQLLRANNREGNVKAMRRIIDALDRLVEQTQEDLAAEREAIGDQDGSGNDNQER